MNPQQSKYTESNAFHKKCVMEFFDIIHSKDIEVTNLETYPLLTINGKGFTSPMTFGANKAQLFIDNIEKIKEFKNANDPMRSLVVKTKGLTVELYLGCCQKIAKYENAIREFLNNPGFLNNA